MFLQSKKFVLISFVYLFALPSLMVAQEKKPETPKETPKQQAKFVPGQALTIDQIVETTIIVYGSRPVFEQIRKTAQEFGKIVIHNPDGSVDKGDYGIRTLRGANSLKDRIRYDQKYPSIEYALIFNEKIFGILTGVVFAPRTETREIFQNQLTHGINNFLRYKEDESKVALFGKEKVFGVEYYVIDLTNKDSGKTRYYVSSKTFRIMWLEYNEKATKYVRKFRDYRYAQNTLVPFRSELFSIEKVMEKDKIVEKEKLLEEQDISTVTFGQKVEEDYFSDKKN